VDGHDTPSGCDIEAGEVTDHADGPPVGSVVVLTYPGPAWHPVTHVSPCATATQNDPPTQEMAVPWDGAPNVFPVEGNTGDFLHAPAPPVGSVETSIFP
jgi:hypothetical protein